MLQGPAGPNGSAFGGPGPSASAPGLWAHHQMEVDSLNRAIWMQHMETPSSIMCAAHHRHALNSRKLARRSHLDPHSFACDDYAVGYKQWLSVTEAEGVLMSSILAMRERCRCRPWERGVSSLEELHDVIYGPRPASESGSTSTHSSMPSLPFESTHVGQGSVDFEALHSDTFAALTPLVRQDLGLMFHDDIPDGTGTNTNASTVTTAPSSSDSSIGALASDAVSSEAEYDPDDPDVFLDALRCAAADYMIVPEEREGASMVNESRE
jgi:hypothetical protein